MIYRYIAQIGPVVNLNSIIVHKHSRYDPVYPMPSIGYSNQTGSQYVYGFRVPLLVVSAYTQQMTPGGGYISGPQSNPMCPNYYCHDFGSILNFVEYVFGTGGNPLGGTGGISPNYHYADVLVQDITPTYPYSLADFFNFNTQRTFTPIPAPLSQACFTGASQCFTTYGLDPDDDAQD